MKTKMKSVIVMSLAMVAATIFAGEKIALDLNSLDSKWQLISAKVMEEDGQKYFHIEDMGGGIASVSYPAMPLNGAKQVKVTLQYRTDVARSVLHSGAWYLIAFSDEKKVIKYDGVFFKLNEQWTALEKILDVPEGAIKFEAQLRVQLDTPKGQNSGKYFDAKDIVIELLK